MESHTFSLYLKFLTYLSLLAFSSIVYASPESPIYKCWENGGKGKQYYTDNKAGQNCVTLRVEAQKAVVPSTELPDAVFSRSSFWYKPLPLDVKLDPNTIALTNEFIRQKTKYYDNVAINLKSYASPVYFPDSKVKAVKVGFNNCQKKTWIDPTFINMISSVPIPSYAIPSGGSDGEMTIYDRRTDTIWELWKASRDSQGSWSACWGGKMENASSNLGVHQKGYGTTATGLPFLGGQITAEELSKSEIKHVIGISMVEVAHNNIVSWPANRSDGFNLNNMPNRIAEGQRFRLDPSVNVDKLPMTKAGKVIAKAAQKYGFVVWDKAGSVSIRAQNSSTYTTLGKPDPYPVLFESKPYYAVLNGFPWDKLQFLPLHYGKP
ncbi:MAG TPA: DUF4124 domain-containing protein [Methylophilaceae bacterium]|nr:DUF4124 domain-containing protein [Methylophilaceae bacterium]